MENSLTKNRLAVKNMLLRNTMLLALVIVMLFFQALIVLSGKGSLFAPANVSNLITQNAYVVVLASGMLLCILTGGNIDLSVGSIVALVGAVAGTLVVNLNANIYISILLCLVLGALIGAWQGFWIAYIRIPPFIVTLAGMLLWRGIALIVLNGLTISPFPSNYLRYFTSFIPGSQNQDIVFAVTIAIGVAATLIYIISQVVGRINKQKKGYETIPMLLFAIQTAVISIVLLLLFFLLAYNKGVPAVLIIISVIVIIYSYFTSNTVPGRYLYALGGNEKAAKMSGINTNRMLFFAYTNMGFLSGVAALMCVARFNSAAPSAGTNYELDAIASCFIGGASAYGGTGTISGAVIGAVFMGVLNNGMSIMGIDSNWQRAVKGLVLLAAVVFDVISKNRKKSA
jgi:putative multiple sugar transport system permease protein